MNYRVNGFLYAKFAMDQIGDGASASLERGKLCGAIRKLTAFRDKVNQLIAAGKINNDPTVGTTGQNLVEDANEAIACVQAAVTASGITCPL